MDREFWIIGAGMGAAEGLTAEAASALRKADVILASAERLAVLGENVRVCAFSQMAEQAIAADAAATALLVSGDVGFFSAAAGLRRALAPYGTVRMICGLSSLQYFCAKCAQPYDRLCVRSVHGRSGSIVGAVSCHERVFVLTGGKQSAPRVLRELTKAGLGGLTVHLGENLGTAEERIESGTAESLSRRACGDLAVLIVENPRPFDPHEQVRDDMIICGKVPMTKEEVRWTALGKLGVHPTDTVWDVGAGTGAMTMALARACCEGTVYAIERNEEALELICANRERFGCYHVQVIAGAAPEALEALPAPDCVFVGGSGGKMREILACAQQKNPAVRVVVTCIALETLYETQKAMQELGFADTEVVQLAAARGRAVGKYTMMTANNPVFILSGGGNEE